MAETCAGKKTGKNRKLIRKEGKEAEKKKHSKNNEEKRGNWIERNDTKRKR